MFEQSVATTDTASKEKSHASGAFQRQVMTVKEFQHAYGVSEAYAYKLMSNNALEYRKMGRKRVIPVDSARVWYDSLPGNRAAA